MRIDRNRALEAYQNYAASFNEQDVKIRLKIEHTYRVATLAEQIAAGLFLAKEDVDLAWLMACSMILADFLRSENTVPSMILSPRTMRP